MVSNLMVRDSLQLSDGLVLRSGNFKLGVATPNNLCFDKSDGGIQPVQQKLEKVHYQSRSSGKKGKCDPPA
jgi:hypothetical protein